MLMVTSQSMRGKAFGVLVRDRQKRAPLAREDAGAIGVGLKSAEAPQAGVRERAVVQILRVLRMKCSLRMPAVVGSAKAECSEFLSTST
jgi:hypothetical protein